MISRFFCTVRAFFTVLFFSAFVVSAADETPYINVYSASKEHLIRPVLDAFTRETGIQVRMTTVSQSAMAARLELEGQDTLADAVIAADVTNLARLAEKQVLMKLDIEQIAPWLSKGLQDPEGRWLAIAKRARLLFIRKDDRLANVSIDSYEDLADAQWDNDVLIRSSDNVYNQSMVADLIIRWGEEKTARWLSNLVDNFARPPQGGDRDQLRALASGLGHVAVANSYYYALMMSGEDQGDKKFAEKLTPIIPLEGAHINIRGAAVTKHSSKPELAKKLIAFLVSEQGQLILTNQTLEFPVREEIDPHPILQTFDLRALFGINHLVYKFGENNAEAVKMMVEAGWK